jgi:CPA2 family monovalent cation:H+ antiporter-2
MEGSLMLASHALVMLGIPLRRVVQRVQAARDERYAALRGYFHGSGGAADGAEHLHVRLHSVVLSDGARAIGKTLPALNLGELGAEVTRIRRGKQYVPVTPEAVLAEGDTVVVRGTANSGSRAEERLLK